MADTEGTNICFRDYYNFREKIAVLVEEGKYRDMTDFIVKAIAEKLDPAKRKSITREEMLDLIDNDVEIRKRLKL